ncbi:MAG: G8 domain-containing protein [Bacteroidota bacterium]
MPQTTLRLSFRLPLFASLVLSLLIPSAHAEDRGTDRTLDRNAFAATAALECNSPIDPAYFADAIFSVAPAGLAPGAAQRWSDPSTWPNGRVPGRNAKVVIEANQTILLDQSTASLKSLTIKGILRFDDRDLDLEAGWILIEGNGSLLEIGTEANPYDHNATITLTATGRDKNVAGSGAFSTGNKFLITRDGGSLAMHGSSRDKTSWTVLDAHVSPGARSLTVAESVNWERGDKIVLAPSGYSPFEAEYLTVESVSGRTVRIQEALQYRHFGAIQTIEGRQIDMRAEVGLLTRNIVVQGDAASEEEVAYSGYRVGFGGHMMFMPGGIVTLEGIEVRDMGQTGIGGRYAMHWHFADYRPSDYVRNSSFHHNFQRAVNIHRTHQVTVENNVAYHTTNHAFVFSEDGDETDNRFVNNLSILNWAVQVEHFAFPRRQSERMSNQGEERAGTFWGRNPHNILIDNRAVGNYLGNGFFFDQQHIQGFGRVRPFLYQDKPITFTGNVAHAIYDIPGGGSFDSYGPEQRGTALFIGFREGPYPLVFGPDFLAYKVSHSGAWVEELNETVKGITVTDSGIGVSPFRGKVEDLFVVGNTANDIGGPIPATTRHLGSVGGINLTSQHQKKDGENERQPRIHNATFVDVEPAAITVEFREIELGSEVSGLTFIRTNPIFFFEQMDRGAIYDADGSLSGTGRPGEIRGEGDPAASIAECDWRGEFSGWFCPDDRRVSGANPHWIVNDAVPGVSYSFWKDDFLDLPEIDGLGGPTETGTASSFNLDAIPLASSYTVRFYGFLNVPETGDYRFVLDAKEGGALHIDNEVVVWSSRPGQPEAHEGWVRLKKGYHAIAVDHYKRLSNPELQLRWEGPGFSMKPVTGSDLIRGTGVQTDPDDGGDDDDGGGDTGENQAPTVSITSPSDGATITANEKTTVKVAASDPDGEVIEVIFYVNGNEQHTDGKSPWQWKPRVPAGEYTLTVVAVDNEGARTTSSPINVSAVNSVLAGGASSQALPTEFAIENVYPNPFNPATTVSLAMPHGGDYDVTVYDVAGRKVMELLLLDQEPGIVPIQLDMSAHASGMYILQARDGESGSVLTERITLLK